MASPTDEETLKSLILKRGQIKGKITRFRNMLSGFDKETGNYVEIETRLKEIRPLLEGFEDAQNNIELLKGIVEDTERESFETAYYSVVADSENLLRKVDVSSGSNIISAGVISRDTTTTNNDSLTLQDRVKLPRINLPDFFGQYDQWITFRDIFNSLINDNAVLSKIEKFHYLKACLKGEALQLIQSVKLCDANYDNAWKLLADRYENSKLIIHTHVRAIFDLQPVKSESYLHLRKLLDNFNKNVSALSALGQPTDTWDTLLIYILSSKLDPTTKRHYEEYVGKKDFSTNAPTTQGIINFIAERCNLLETLENKNNKPHVKEKYHGYTDKSYSHLGSTTKFSCAFCGKGHLNFNCDKFVNLSISEKYVEIDKHRLCSNCLRPGHFSKDCRTPGCKFCHQKHNALLHRTKARDAQNFTVPSNQNNRGLKDGQPLAVDADAAAGLLSLPNTSRVGMALGTVDHHGAASNLSALSVKGPGAYTSRSCDHEEDGQVLLATAEIFIQGRDGALVSCKALLDSGSMSNFITKDLLRKLNLDCANVNIPVAGISGSLSNISTNTRATIFSRLFDYTSQQQFLVINKITDSMPRFSFDPCNLVLPKNIALADPNFNLSNPIDILLGAQIFFDILEAGQIRLGKNKPILQESKLGWFISGPMGKSLDGPNRQLTCGLAITNKAIHSQIEKFWKIEECSVPKQIYTREEKECEENFIATFKRDSTGRCQVNLPFKDNVSDLGKSENMAVKRFLNLERKLQRDSSLKEKYVDFMREYEDLGHMTEIDRANDTAAQKYYLPHFCVIRENSSTTKLRTVFDASATSDSGLSLNDVLKIGPVIQRELFEIILNFRQHNVAFCSDVLKMYRQVLVSETDRNFQRIVWRESPDQILKHYRLNTVTYGTAPASFLAVRCLFRAAEQYERVYPEASRTIKRDFYMDDLISGAESVETAFELIKQITEILNEYKLPLHKWCSNATTLLNNSTDEDKKIAISDDTIHKTLGLSWEPKYDILSYEVECDISGAAAATKRAILSAIGRLFDPLGLVGPVVIRAKLIMQKLWLSGVGWDEPVEPALLTSWLNFREQLPDVNNIRVPRQVTMPNFIKIQLHAFCDASERGFGACVFIRVSDAFGKTQVRLLCAKSRVAPLKTISLARLELCGALLLAQLVQKVNDAQAVPFAEQYYWCDSTIALAWIATEPSLLKTFVANRVTEIQILTNKNSWRYVNTADNPADILSRGCSPKELACAELWWTGPEFLSKEAEEWPTKSLTNEHTDKSEHKTQTNLNFLAAPDNDYFNKFSNFTTLIRVTALALRFSQNCKAVPDQRKFNNLSLEELQKATIRLVNSIQKAEFPQEINCLTKGQALPNSSKLTSLNVFMDSEGLLRVGGRLQHAQVHYNKKHPLIIPPRHPFTELVIRHEHLRLLHAGSQAILAAVRNRFWPINGKNTVKRVLRNCLQCFKAKPKTENAQMGDLPRARVLPARPFFTTGVDFAGPLLIKDGVLRTRKLVKAYICIFVCFVTKAVHIELVGDLTKESFLNCLKRFIARRGLCKVLYSDNGTNFIGSSNDLKRVILWVRENVEDTEIRNFLLKNEVEWKFIPPRAPHMGGLWERAVRSAKTHLVKVVGDAHLTYEQLYTILCQVEGVLNSRPLTALSDDPNDYSALTPGHFLIGDSLATFPERYPEDEVPVNRLKIYERLQAMLRHFWKRWSSEYLTSIQHRVKWQRKNDTAVQVGDLVLLKDDNLPALQWRLGRVSVVHPGTDNIVRVVTVKTSAGEVKRNITKVCVLPIDKD